MVPRIPIRRYFSLLAQYLRPRWPSVLLLSALLLASIGLELYSPQLLRQVIDAAAGGAELDELTRMAVLYIGIALANQLLMIGATWVGESVGWAATNELRENVARHCLRLDMAFHNARPSGTLIERIDGDVTALANFFSQFVIRVLGSAVLLAGVLVALYREDWRIGLGLTLFAAFAMAVMMRMRSFAVPFWTRVREMSAEFAGFVGETIAAAEDVKSAGATGYAMRRLTEILRRWRPIQQRAGVARYSMWMTTIGVFAIGSAIAFALGARLYLSGAITLGTVFLVFQYTQLLRRPVDQLRTQLQELQEADASIVRIDELLRTAPAIVDGRGDPIPPGPLAVELDRVTFGYDDEPVLRDVSFRLAPGRTLGLLGRTGSGKTTITRLLLRFYDPTAGAVRLGRVDLRHCRLAEVRERVGMVTQEVQLFQATVRDNLTFFDERIADERILDVLDALGLWAWYRALPDGLDSMLQSGSGGLSAGEAQLVAFARVFLKDPGLVMLDEASSRLDLATERLVQRATERLLENRTGIIIAHRLATVQRADEILILERGEIAEAGDRARLAADPASRFHHLLRTGLEVALV